MPATSLSEKIAFLQKKLLTWYKMHGRDFPWRRNGLSQYEYVIAEVLLQRTKAETVSRFYISFIKDYPSWESLSSAKIKDIETYMIPIGLYRQRSKRLMNLAEEMVKRKGKLPKEREDLESIPYMGQYIANAVELIIFKQPHPLIDVNMSRLIERFFGPRKKADIRYDPYLQELAYKVVNHGKAKEINWAILDYAALVCKSGKPKCEICVIAAKCLYLKQNPLWSGVT